MFKDLVKRPLIGAASAAARSSNGLRMHVGFKLARFFSSGWRKASETLPIYYPKRKLDFKDGKLLLCKAQFKGFYLFCLGTMPVIFLATYWSTKKLYHFQDRSFFGLLFYSIVASGCFFSLNSGLKNMSRIVTKIWLSSTGKSIFIKTGLPFSRTKEFFIKDIERPELHVDYVMSKEGLVGYPVSLNEETYLLPKYMDKLNQEVFSAVFNGMEIAVSGEQEGDIIIE